MSVDHGDVDSTSRKIVEAVAKATNTSPMDLSPPLYETIDLEALETLVHSHERSAIRVTFRYRGHDVTVTGGGVVEVEAGSDAET
ncbi:HalOD1 output domain-containing protein [Haloferacaceae archaeon DSL9]